MPRLGDPVLVGLELATPLELRLLDEGVTIEMGLMLVPMRELLRLGALRWSDFLIKREACETGTAGGVLAGEELEGLLAKEVFRVSALARLPGAGARGRPNSPFHGVL